MKKNVFYQIMIMFALQSYAAAVNCYEEIDPNYRKIDIPSQVHVSSANDVIRIRENMIKYLWKETGWPGNKMPSNVQAIIRHGSAIIPPTAHDSNCLTGIKGLVLWLDAADTNTITRINGNYVAKIRDKSACLNHASQSKDVFQPSYVESAINGKPSLYFDGKSNFLEVLSNGSLDAKTLTIFIVAKTSKADNAACSVLLSKMPIKDSYAFSSDANNVPVFGIHVNSAYYAAKSLAPEDGAAHVWTGNYDGTRVRLFRDGSQNNYFGTSVTGSNSTTSDNLRIGGGAGNAYNGYVSEIIIYNSAISDSDRQKVQDYLAAKYAIAISPFSWITGIGSANIDNVDKLTIGMDYGMVSIAYLLRPKTSNNRLLIFQMGHGDSLLDYGGQQTMKYFLDHGFSLMTFWMPLYGENPDIAYGVPGHGTLTFWPAGHSRMSDTLENSRGSFIRFFVEPVIVGINYVKHDYNYRDITMTGISGGGWTTHLCAALDTRISLSFPVAGSLPLYLRHGPCANNSLGDPEQYWPALYENVASWLDIYILGSYGNGRGQVQILNKYDSCCFGGINYQTYEPYVKDIVAALGAGYYYVYLDTSHREHRISDTVISEVIYPKIFAAGGDKHK